VLEMRSSGCHRAEWLEAIARRWRSTVGRGNSWKANRRPYATRSDYMSGAARTVGEGLSPQRATRV